MNRIGLVALRLYAWCFGCLAIVCFVPALFFYLAWAWAAKRLDGRTAMTIGEIADRLEADPDPDKTRELVAEALKPQRLRQQTLAEAVRTPGPIQGWYVSDNGRRH